MKKQPKVSVIIPTYNRAKIIHKTIESALSQTFRNFEVIIVDDGSEDDTRSIVEQYNGVKYIYQPHRNVSCARNNGISHANGEYIAFLDSDDVWLPMKLEKQVRFLNTSEVAMVHTDRHLICMPNNRRSQLLPTPQKLANDRHHLLSGTSNIAMTVMVKKEVLEEIGCFDEALTTTQDIDLWYRIAKSYEIALISDQLMYSYKYEDSLCASNFEQKYTDRLTVYQRLLQDDHPLINKEEFQQRMINTAYALAIEKYKKGKYFECSEVIKEFVSLDPCLTRAS